MDPQASNNLTHHEQDTLSFERIVFFSDAVFAIAITLLVIEIKVPVIVHHEDRLFPTVEELRQHGPFELVRLIPKFIGYVLSFLVIGQYWINHHRNFGYIKRSDPGLLWRNLFLLMSIAFIPFTTGLYSEYYFWNMAMMIYAANIFVAGILQWRMWQYATKNHRLVDSSLNRHFIEKISLSHIGTPVAFLLAFVAGWLNIPFALSFVWIIIPIMVRFARRRYEQRVANEQMEVGQPI